MTGTWNSFDNAGLTLSNGNLTATNLSGSGVWYTCRATPFFLSSNRVYAEFTATAVGISDSNVYIAVMTGNAALSIPGLFDANSFGYNQNGTTTYNGTGATLATWTTGNVICLAVDGNAGKVWARVNGGNWNNDGTGTANPTSNVGGISTPSLFNQGPIYFGTSIHTLNYAVTGNFNGTFAFAVPSGFIALPPVTATPSNSVSAIASGGMLRGVNSRAGSGVAASSGVGLLLPTTSAIGSVVSTARAGIITFKQTTQPLTGVSGLAQAQAIFAATATTIYSYEGFDHQAAQADLLQGTITSFVNSTGSLSPLTPYNSGSSLAVQVSGTAGYALYNSGPFTLSRCVLGVMTRSNMFTSIGTDVGFMIGNTVQLFCRLSGSNIKVYRGPLSAPVLLSTILYAIPATGWFFLELNVVIAAASGGSLTINVNGVQVASLPTLTSSSDGTPRLNGILLGGITPAATVTSFLFDDVYVATTVLGTTRVATMFPNANGNVVQFLTSGTTANWHRVNDPTNDADISYNFSSTFALVDEFAVTPLPASISSIVALKVTISARKDSTSSRMMGTLVLSNASTSLGVTNVLTNNYQYLSDIFLIDPNTGSAWTRTSANAAQIGYNIR